MKNRVEIGHVGRFWVDDFKNLSFTKQPVTDEEIKTWEDMGYDHVKSFSGSMYDSRNPMPNWVSTLDQMFGLYNQAYTFYRMDTLEIMPKHVDHYRTYCRLNNTTPDKVCRVIMMLEDWKPGHYFELDGVGYVNWKAGDWFKWRGDVPHAASNIGVEPRYTLQITGMSAMEGQLNKLIAHNVPDYNSNTNHPLFKQEVQSKIDKDHYMIYLHNKYITELDSINHELSSIETLNDKGLHIYLYEPLCSYKAPWDRHTQGFYSEFESDILPHEMRAEELDSIYNYARRNNLTNVTVHTCDYNVHDWYPAYTDLMTLLCDDLFLLTQKKIINLNEQPTGRFIRNFICLNWRFTKHRQLLSTFLAGEDGHLSWYYKADFEVLKKDLFFDLESWKTKYPKHYEKLKNGCDIINTHSPLTVDKKEAVATVVEDPFHVHLFPKVSGMTADETPALYNRISNNLSNYYFDVFVDIVNETKFAQPTANYSEKTYQAIQYMKPFVLVAPPKTLEYLRSMGFKTFSDFWDESYDDEFDHGERLAKIFTLIDEIFSMPNEKQREVYEQMNHILTHNLSRYKQLTNRNPWNAANKAK